MTLNSTFRVFAVAIILLVVPQVAVAQARIVVQNPVSSSGHVLSPSFPPNQQTGGQATNVPAKAIEAGAAQSNVTGGGTPRIANTPAQNNPAERSTIVPTRPGGESASGAIANEFQELVAQSVGKLLPLLGYSLFQDTPTTFAPVENIPVTPDYTVGPGDEVVLRGWGQVDIDFRAIVDRNGTINIPKVGVINVSGIKYQALADYLKTAIGRVFRNFELTVSLGQLRSIQVLVVGQARQPGSYTVSSLSTLVNAIFAVGGPSARGTMRSIQLKRGNRVVAEFDLYDLLVNGDKSKDAQLLPGDVIYFPPVGPQVALSGSVNSPGIFELKGHTTVANLIEWAGGLTTVAKTSTATIERIRDRTARIVGQFPLESGEMNRPIQDGDLISVLPISPRFENAVTLRGNVAVPMRHPYRQGMRVKDLIPDREALLTTEYYLRRNLDIRSDIPGQAPSRGEIRRQSEVNWEYASIERLNPSDLSTNLISFHLGRAILDGDPKQNLLLQPGDVVTIFSKDDISIPLEKKTSFVRVEGEIGQAGIFQAGSGETLRQLISRVGGVSPNAYLFGAELTRESTRVQQQKAIDDAINRMEMDVQRSGAASAQGSIDSEGLSSVKQRIEAQQSLIAKLRTVRATGRIVLGINNEQAGVNDLPDLKLEDGDRFFVPSRPSTINVLGAVYNPSTLVYRPGRRMAEYLAESGGPTRDADRSSIYVLKADGSVVSARQGGLVFGGVDGRVLAPGDSIVVPEELEKTSFMRNLKDIAQIFYQFGLGAAAIKVLRD